MRTDELLPDSFTILESDLLVRLSDFTQLGMMGKGSSGCVRKIRHKPSGFKIALKEILMQSDEQIRKRILFELNTLKDCQHENVVSAYTFFIKNSKVHIALEYMNAGSLDQIL
jgi:serine/threonine protein kinase